MASPELPAIDGYADELRDSGLLDVIAEASAEFRAVVRGRSMSGVPYGFAALAETDIVRMYGLVRCLRPKFAVETGVCNGASTAAILLALEHNGVGVLHSID